MNVYEVTRIVAQVQLVMVKAALDVYRHNRQALASIQLTQPSTEETVLMAQQIALEQVVADAKERS